MALSGLAGATLALAAGAEAAPVTLNGITFSDEQGGVVIREGRGRGTPEEPFVLVEDITEDGPAILTIRGLDRQITGQFGSQPVGGFALVKIVTNRTQRYWTVFECELRETLAHPSTYEDGLSFAQAASDLSGFGSDRFRQVHRTDEPLDAVEYEDGLVRPGETVRVSMLITDYTPVPEFFLLQRREGEVAALPRPSPG